MDGVETTKLQDFEIGKSCDLEVFRGILAAYMRAAQEREGHLLRIEILECKEKIDLLVLCTEQQAEDDALAEIVEIISQHLLAALGRLHNLTIQISITHPENALA